MPRLIRHQKRSGRKVISRIAVSKFVRQYSLTIAKTWGLKGSRRGGASSAQAIRGRLLFAT